MKQIIVVSQDRPGMIAEITEALAKAALARGHEKLIGGWPTKPPRKDLLQS